jgi:hypothetical protein
MSNVMLNVFRDMSGRVDIFLKNRPLLKFIKTEDISNTLCTWIPEFYEGRREAPTFTLQVHTQKKSGKLSENEYAKPDEDNNLVMCTLSVGAEKNMHLTTENRKGAGICYYLPLEKRDRHSVDKAIAYDPVVLVCLPIYGIVCSLYGEFHQWDHTITKKSCVYPEKFILMVESKRPASKTERNVIITARYDDEYEYKYIIQDVTSNQAICIESWELLPLLRTIYKYSLGERFQSLTERVSKMIHRK